MKKILLVIVFLFTISVSPTFAASSYVLPYPSTMPGGISYKLHVVLEKIMAYWYFGNLGQFDYNLKESDKYLVEAKTLFDYQQYLLGFSALQKSNQYFILTLPFLQKAQQGKIDITDKRELLRQAALKHMEVLKNIEQNTPASFNWQPEKAASQLLPLHSVIEEGIAVRKKYL